MLCSSWSPAWLAGSSGVAPIEPIPASEVRCVVHASLIHSEREIFFTSHDLSMAAVSVSSIVTEYRTILDRFAGARNEYFDHKVHQKSAYQITKDPGFTGI